MKMNHITKLAAMGVIAVIFSTQTVLARNASTMSSESAAVDKSASVSARTGTDSAKAAKGPGILKTIQGAAAAAAVGISSMTGYGSQIAAEASKAQTTTMFADVLGSKAEAAVAEETTKEEENCAIASVNASPASPAASPTQIAELGNALESVVSTYDLSNAVKENLTSNVFAYAVNADSNVFNGIQTVIEGLNVDAETLAAMKAEIAADPALQESFNQSVQTFGPAYSKDFMVAYVTNVKPLFEAVIAGEGIALNEKGEAQNLGAAADETATRCLLKKS